MAESIAAKILELILLYVAIGVVFGIPFVFYGVARVDSQAKGTGIAFRLLILPGVAALWPLLLKRWIDGATDPPEPSTPHRMHESVMRGSGVPR